MLIKGGSISNRLNQLNKNIKCINKAIKNKEDSVELFTEWISGPFDILPLVALANKKGIIINNKTKSKSVYEYLDNIKFPVGVTLFKCSIKGIPICNIPVGDNDCLSKFENIILKNISRLSQTALRYFTSELQNNVKDHANVDNYWILAQNYSDKKECELCIVDTGVGFKKSYENTQYEVKSDAAAIRQAMEGVSSKKEERRGCGLISVIRMVTQGLNGSLVILSGNKGIYITKNKAIEYHFSAKWEGAIVLLRFSTNKPFNWTKYTL